MCNCSAEPLDIPESFCGTAGTVHNLGLTESWSLRLRLDRVWKASVDPTFKLGGEAGAGMISWINADFFFALEEL